jgi:hypothetical protein
MRLSAREFQWRIRNELTPDVVCVLSAGMDADMCEYTGSACCNGRGLQYGVSGSEPKSGGVMGRGYELNCIGSSGIWE